MDYVRGWGLFLRPPHDMAITNQNEKSKLSVSDVLLSNNINLRLVHFLGSSYENIRSKPNE